MKDQLLTTAELAARYKVKPATVRLWRQRLGLPARMASGNIMVSWSNMAVLVNVLGALHEWI